MNSSLCHPIGLPGWATKALLIAVVLLLGACSEPGREPDADNAEILSRVLAEPLSSENPFYQASSLQFNYPRFDLIEVEDFLPALLQGMAQQSIEVEAIASQSAAPGFANTIVALELSGQTLNRVTAVFDNYVLVKGGDDLLALQQQMTPLLAAHDQQIVRNQNLFQRIETLYQLRNSLELDDESRYLLENYYQGFLVSGAGLAAQQQRRLEQIDVELQLLQVIYSQNSLQESINLAEQLTLSDHGVDILEPSSDQSFLALVDSREKRQRIHEAAISRGSRGNEFDNRQILVQILQLRADKAGLLGFENFAALNTSMQSIRSTETIERLFENIIPHLTNSLQHEAQALQDLLNSSGNDFQLAAWDWRYYLEKQRLSKQANQSSELDLRAYFELETVLTRGVFFAAEQLYGLSFEERFDLPIYHEDVRVFEVFDAVGSSLGIFIADYFARAGKMTGAWTNSYVSQSELLRNQAVVANHLNLEKPGVGQPALLSFEEVSALFHEFGHALQSLFSEVTYPYFSGSRVVEDFVEYAGLANEIWASSPQVLANYAVHYQSGEPLAQTYQQSIGSSELTTQAYSVTEVLSSALLDLALHQQDEHEVFTADEVLAFEFNTLQQAGMDPDLLPPRYGSTYFLHIMGGFAASYYSYILNDIIEADTAQWFRDNGGLRRENGSQFRQSILSKGGSSNALDNYRSFRGGDIDATAYLKKNGFIE